MRRCLRPVGAGQVLGGLRWEVAGDDLPIVGRRRSLLLGLLMVHAPAPVPLTDVCAAVWPQRRPQDVRPAAQVQIHRLRRVLAPLDHSGPRIRSHDDGYALDVADVFLDAVVFRRHLGEARRLVRDGRGDPAATLIRRALALWAGPPLGRWYPGASSWPEVRRLCAARRDAVASLVEIELAADRADAVLPELRRAVAEHPADERLHDQLLRVLHRCGRHRESAGVHRARLSRAAPPAGTEPGRTPQGSPLPARRRGSPAAPDGAVPARPVEVRSVRRALLRSADFAESMGAHGQAGECLRAVLTVTAADDPGRARLLLRLAEQRCRDTGDGAAEAREAWHLFADGRDEAGTAEAELVIARIAWCAGELVGARRALARARTRMAAVAHPWPATLTASSVGLLAVTRQPAEAAAEADAALRTGVGALGDWETARLLCNRGIARLALGDPAALDDCRAAAAHHERSAGWVAVVLSANLMDATATLGDLATYALTLDQAQVTARLRGSALDRRFLAAGEAWRHFWAGDLAGAGWHVERWLQEDGRHFLTVRCEWLAARLTLAAGDRSAARAVLERLTGPAGQSSLWQAEVYANLLAAALDVERQRSPLRARQLVEDAVDAIGSRFVPPEVGVLLPATMHACGLPGQALDAAAPSPWRDAAQAYLRGERHRAAAIYRRIGSRPDAAGCRGRAARPRR